MTGFPSHSRDFITIDFVWLKKITKPLLVLACETNNLNSKISLNKSIVIISKEKKQKSIKCN